VFGCACGPAVAYALHVRGSEYPRRCFYEALTETLQSQPKTNEQVTRRMSRNFHFSSHVQRQRRVIPLASYELYDKIQVIPVTLRKSMYSDYPTMTSAFEGRGMLTAPHTHVELAAFARMCGGWVFSIPLARVASNLWSNCDVRWSRASRWYSMRRSQNYRILRVTCS